MALWKISAISQGVKKVFWKVVGRKIYNWNFYETNLILKRKKTRLIAKVRRWVYRRFKCKINCGKVGLFKLTLTKHSGCLFLMNL